MIEVEGELGERGQRPISPPSCKDCKGKCCQYLMINVPDNEAELLRIRGGRQIDRGKYVFFLPCFYFDKGICTIYQRRPQICKDFVVGCEVCRLLNEKV